MSKKGPSLLQRAIFMGPDTKSCCGAHADLVTPLIKILASLMRIMTTILFTACEMNRK
jgi:hypothetical protein